MKCDICKKDSTVHKYVVRGERGGIDEKGGDLYWHYYRDLCSECAKEFGDKIIHKEEKGE